MDSKPSYLKSLQIIFRAMFLGQLMFAAIMLFLVMSGKLNSPNAELGNILLTVAVAISVGAVAAAYVLFRNRVEIAKQQNNLTAKLDGYRAAYVIQLALSEGPTLLAIIFYFVSGNRALWIVIVLLLINFLNLSPSKSKISQQLELNGEEESMLDQGPDDLNR